MERTSVSNDRKSGAYKEISGVVDECESACYELSIDQHKLGNVKSEFTRLRTALAGYENEVIERCAAVCDDERVDAASTGEATDESYNIATEHCAAAIRAMKKEG